MSFKDRPFFRRILQFDDLMRRGRPVTCTSLARSWETSTKTVQRFVEQMRDDFDAPLEFDRAKRSYRYTDASFRLPWLPVEGKDLFAIGIAMKVFQIYEGTPVKEDLKAVFDRLQEMMPREIRVNPSSLVERLYIHPAPLRLVTPKVWDAVCDALRDQTVLEIDYQKPAKDAARSRARHRERGGGDEGGVPLKGASHPALRFVITSSIELTAPGRDATLTS